MIAVPTYLRPDFATLGAVLGNCRSESDPAELHGSLCSLICVYGSAAAEIWFSQSLAGADPDSGAAAQCADYLREVFIYTEQALYSAEMEFSLLLPDDVEPVRYRAESIAAWAAGFLHGLGTGADLPDLRERLSRDPLQEIIQDMAAISEASEDESGAEESADEALTELTEYLRVALQLSYEELTPVRAAVAPPENILH